MGNLYKLVNNIIVWKYLSFHFSDVKVNINLQGH